MAANTRAPERRAAILHPRRIGLLLIVLSALTSTAGLATATAAVLGSDDGRRAVAAPLPSAFSN